MKKILGILGSAYCWLSAITCHANDKFDILPDLPDPLVGTAALASSVTTTDVANDIATQSIGHEPNLISIVFSLVFVLLLIYVTGIIYTKLNKLGFMTMKRQMGNKTNSHVSVVSTTALGGNKTLHVVELDGKRMLIGASTNSIHLIKDLGSTSICEIEEGEYSKIEIPNIRIPKIEIPKIEIPNIGFTKIVKNPKPDITKEDETQNNDNSFEISDIYEENSEGIIDSLFKTSTEESLDNIEKTEIEHKVDPDEFALYKKYLS